MNDNKRMNDFLRQAAGHQPPAQPEQAPPPIATVNAGSGVTGGLPPSPADMNHWLRTASLKKG